MVPARRALLVGVVLFVLLESGAMALYPGGTFWDPAARGHRFWENFLCDLEWRTALDGQDNRVGSMLAQAAMLVLVAAFVPFWSLTGHARSGRTVRALGYASVVAMAAVAFMPSERFGSWHGAAVVLAGITGLGAAGFAIRRQLQEGQRVEGGLGALVLTLATLDLGLYVRTFQTGGPGPVALPAIQKLALGCLLGWMVRVATAPPSPGAP